jgi:SET domain-containing protein
MYLVKIFVGESKIEGKGVFAAEDIKEGTITWKFDPSHDKVLSCEQFEALDDKIRKNLLRVAYFSPTTKRWIYPASFTNHSIKNNQSVVFNESVSEEPFFKANRDIKNGDELTVNYSEFDSRPNELLEKWI